MAWDILPGSRAAAAQGVSENRLDNSRIPKVSMGKNNGTVSKTRNRAYATGVSHDLYTIISLSSLCEDSIRRVKVV